MDCGTSATSVERTFLYIFIEKVTNTMQQLLRNTALTKFAQIVSYLPFWVFNRHVIEITGNFCWFRCHNLHSLHIEGKCGRKWRLHLLIANFEISSSSGDELNYRTPFSLCSIWKQIYSFLINMFKWKYRIISFRKEELSLAVFVLRMILNLKIIYLQFFAIGLNNKSLETASRFRKRRLVSIRSMIILLNYSTQKNHAQNQTYSIRFWEGS